MSPSAYISALSASALCFEKSFSSISVFIKVSYQYSEISEIHIRRFVINSSVQPLLENSIMHSFEPNKPGQKIAISIKKETENSIIITVSDNGKGIDKEKLKKIQNSLKDEEPSSKHIGIKNVHLRYRLLYGEEFGIIAIESDNTGTRVHLRTPYHKF